MKKDHTQGVHGWVNQMAIFNALPINHVYLTIKDTQLASEWRENMFGVDHSLPMRVENVS